MEDHKQQALDGIAMQDLSDQEIIERMRIVFKTVEGCHAAISYASSMIVRKAKSVNNDGRSETAEVMRSLLDDIKTLKRLAIVLKENTKNEGYEDFI